MDQFLDIIVRCIAVYAFILVAIRFSGKTELSQLNTSDIVFILLISNAVQNAMVGPNTSLLGGIVAALVLFLLNFILKKLIFRNKKIRDLVNDKPHILIHNGKLDFAMLAKLEISNDELEEAVREHGVAHYRDVKLAILEVDGNISVISGDESLKASIYKRRKKHSATAMIS